MATIEIELFVDSDGNVRGVVDGNESHDDLDNSLACRTVKLTVEVPEPTAQEITVEVPEAAQADATVKVKT